MQTVDLFFNLFVFAAFVASTVDHYFVGQGQIKKPLRAFLLGCFMFTEGYLAFTHPMLWFYFVLNWWGLLNLFYGRHGPLLTRRRRK